MSHDTASPDTAVGLDGWKALVATIPPRSPQLSARGDLAYVATDDLAVGARVRIVAPTGDAAGRTVTEHPEHTPRWSPSGRQLAFVAASPQGDEIHIVAADGSAQSTVAAGEGWRVDDLQWIDEGCLALIAAPLITDTAVGRGSQHAARPAPVRWCARTTACADGSSPWTCRPAGPSWSTPDQRRCGRCVHSAASASWRSSRTTRPSPAGTPPGCRCWTVSEASSRCTSRRGRSPPPGCRPTGHASRWSRGGRAIVGSSPAASS